MISNSTKISREGNWIHPKYDPVNAPLLANYDEPKSPYYGDSFLNSLENILNYAHIKGWYIKHPHPIMCLSCPDNDTHRDYVIQTKNNIFFIPDGYVHYIRYHGYRPTQEFEYFVNNIDRQIELENPFPRFYSYAMKWCLLKFLMTF